jgi:dipeptidyl aminopeptidase/acylaminoacyl peptidase
MREKYAAAARKAGVDLEYVVYPEERHGFFLTKNRTGFYQRVEKFLARWIGPDSKKP